ncbi:MAG: aminofutalosine synthase MqnE [Syntrophus sp. (in: bacteria)]|nr:aminofutalosine synthase MqnE [Syntrophus sp. (in: bacteria)]
MTGCSSLSGIAGKVHSGEAISSQDALRLLSQDVSLGYLGELAHLVRTRIHGNKAFFVRNLHLNLTNVCASTCKFCSFRKVAGDSAAFTLKIEDVEKLIHQAGKAGAREVHFVNALNPDLSLEYYVDVIRVIKKVVPYMTIKGFTAVEVDFLSRLSGGTWASVIDALSGAGVECLPGGGAEIFNPGVRELLGTKKLPGRDWLKIHEIAHSKGVLTNATMLYGHFEGPEDIIEHLSLIRDLQEKTKGFQAFIPLKFMPRNTELPMKESSAVHDLRITALSRIFLSNVPHIKAYWVSLTPEIAQIALSFGADDLDGTIMKERIFHAAGAQVKEGMSPEEMRGLIHDAGFEPVERNSFYSEVKAGQ